MADQDKPAPVPATARYVCAVCLRHKAGCLFLTQLPGNAKQAGKTNVSQIIWDDTESAPDAPAIDGICGRNGETVDIFIAVNESTSVIIPS